MGLVEPERLVLPLEPQPELAEVLPVVDVRPEDPLELAALADRDEDRAVAGDRRGRNANRRPVPSSAVVTSGVVAISEEWPEDG